MSKLFNISFEYQITDHYGDGKYLSNNSIFGLFRENKIDFAGPDYFFSKYRREVAIASQPIIYHEIDTYSNAKYPEANFELSTLLGPIVFPIVIMALVGIFTLASSEIQTLASMNKLKVFLTLHKIPTILFVAVVGIILNLYTSLLSVKCISQEIYEPSVPDIHQLRQMLETGKIHLIVPEKTSGESFRLMEKIVLYQSDERVRKMMRNIEFADGAGANSALLALGSGGGNMAVLDHFYVQGSQYWLSNCTRISRSSAIHIFGNLGGGFHFSMFNQTEARKWFQDLISKKSFALGSLFKLVVRKYSVADQSNLKCVNGYMAPPEYSISLSTSWNVGFKVIWLPGLVIAIAAVFVEYFSKHTRSGDES